MQEPELPAGFGLERDLTGATLDGRYRVLQRLGAGGMGAVYRGEHVMLGTEVAIKVLLPRYAHDAEWVQRFLLEARAASRIRHPNIVQMHDFAAPRPGLVYMVMELLEGESLADLARREGTLPWPRVARIIEQVAEALAAAHARGIIHRDIKPPNCFRVSGHHEPDFIKVLDFGIAKFLAGADEDVESPSTVTGALMGTPEYIAPEIFQGLRPDPRADIYSLGVMTYKLLTGRVPFMGNHIMVAQQMMAGDPLPPSRAAPPGVVVPAEVDALVLRTLRRDPAERMSSMTELLTAIRTCRPVDAMALAPTLTAVPTPPSPSVVPRAAPAAEESTTEVKPPPPTPASAVERRGEVTTPSVREFDPQPAPEPARSIVRPVAAAAMLLGMVAVAVAMWIDVGQSDAPGPVIRERPPEPSHPSPTALPPIEEPVAEEVAPTTAPPPSPAPAPPPAAPGEKTTGEPSSAPPIDPAPAETTAPAARTRDKPALRDLDSGAILKRLQSMEAAIQRDCFKKHGTLAGVRVKADVSVDPRGRAQVTLTKPRSLLFAACIAERIEGHRFSVSQQGGRAEYTFVARE